MTADLEIKLDLQTQENSGSLVIPIGAVTELPGVGFHPWMEVNVLRQDFLRAQGSENSKEILGKWLVKARKNLVGYWQEYIDQRLILPIDLEVSAVNGQRRVISRGIKNAVWIDSIGSWERNGSVKDSAIKIEEFLVNAPPLSAAVLVGPGGQEYPDTQTYIFWVNQGGDVDAMTVRTDPNIEDNELFLINTKLDFNPDTNATLSSRVESVIRNPLFLTAENGYGFSPESIIETIRTTKSGHTAFKDKDFTELYKDLANRNELLGAGKLVEAVISEFSNFCVQTIATSGYSLNNNNCKLIENRLGETILKLAYIKRRLQGSEVSFKTAVYRLNNLSYHDYRNELGYLQTIPGCAGGGLKNYINNGFGFREIATNSTESWHNGTCRICKAVTWVGPCSICSICANRL